jgi:hypothetical protein
MECPICFETDEILFKLNCSNSHELCQVCINKLSVCPFCRQRIKPSLESSEKDNVNKHGIMASSSSLHKLYKLIM